MKNTNIELKKVYKIRMYGGKSVTGIIVTHPTDRAFFVLHNDKDKGWDIKLNYDYEYLKQFGFNYGWRISSLECLDVEEISDRVLGEL